jgi:hypothetical protein
MLIRLLFVGTLALVFASPAVAAHHGGSGIVGPTRVGDLKMGVSTGADVRAFAGNPGVIDDRPDGYTWLRRWGYNCRGRHDCHTYYEFDRATDRLTGFSTSSTWFHTRRGTRVGDTRKRAERHERRKADLNLCDGGTHAILREHGDHALYILFSQRRVIEMDVDSTFVDC